MCSMKETNLAVRAKDLALKIAVANYQPDRSDKETHIQCGLRGRKIFCELQFPSDPKTNLQAARGL